MLRVISWLDPPNRNQIFDCTFWKTYLPFKPRYKKHNKPDDYYSIDSDGNYDIERYALLSKSKPNDSNAYSDESTTPMKNEKNPNNHWKDISSPDKHPRIEQPMNVDVEERYVGFGIGGAGNMRKYVRSPATDF